MKTALRPAPVVSAARSAAKAAATSATTSAALHAPIAARAGWVLGAVVLATLLGVTAVRVSGTRIQEPDAASVSTRLLRFDDGPQGSVRVFDGRTGQHLQDLHGEQGFLRGALRALARERRMRELGPALPFELNARADGRLTLIDTATQARVDLESFGPTNAAVFARMLSLGLTSSAMPSTRTTP